jgi:NTP pyrophosphatase (non-canonical NTP hydrolase)
VRKLLILDKTDIYTRAIHLWGPASQLRQLQEECGELIAEINRLVRGRSSLETLASEIADVEIMLEQARLIIDDKIVDEMKKRKLDRLVKRIEESERSRDDTG